MGEVAEMMLDGTLCEECGGYIGDAVGYPRSCHGCRPVERSLQKVQCPTCGKLVKAIGLAHHRRDKHGG